MEMPSLESMTKRNDSGMHAALRIREIQSLIFNVLVHDLKALARLARCCTSFRDPALDSSWPDEYLSESECIRLDFYARRVRYINDSSDQFHNSAVIRLATLRPSRCFFPNLRELKLTVGPGGHVPDNLPALNLPSIRRIEFSNSTDGDVAYSVLRSLSALGPSFNELKVAGKMPHLIQSFIARHPQLASIDLEDCQIISPTTERPPIYHELLREVAGMPSLTTLILPKNLHLYSIPDSYVGFPCLTKLDICGPPTMVTKFLRMLSPGVLEDFEVYPQDSLHESQQTAKQWFDCLKTLHERGATSLRRVIIESRLTGLGSSVPVGKLLQPLLGMRKLENLSLLYFPKLQSSHVRSMSAAWPALKRLVLSDFNITDDFEDNGLNSDNSTSSILRSAIYDWDFFSQVPRLFENLDFLSITMPLEGATLEENAGVHHNLRHLWILTPHGGTAVMALEKKILYARVLNRLFPRLDDLFIDGETPDLFDLMLNFREVAAG
ncbi:hypothetical protein HWV62_28704 [Athelia sp. TMB]|nr:hypothetical protein HWV62_28704 [Athelia sp. TMB]